MKDTLETKLHNYLKSQGGKHISYRDIKYLVENVWKTSKGGFYRMSTLERRARRDNTKENDIADRIGKTYKDNCIIDFYYKTDSLITPYKPLATNLIKTPQAKAFLEKWLQPKEPKKELTLW